MTPPIGLEVDIDTRLHGLWDVVLGSILYTEVQEYERRRDIGLIIRSAYLSGYRDAIDEFEAGEPCKMYDEHNIAVV